jgi:hypothetical protein
MLNSLLIMNLTNTQCAFHSQANFSSHNFSPRNKCIQVHHHKKKRQTQFSLKQYKVSTSLEITWNCYYFNLHTLYPLMSISINQFRLAAHNYTNLMHYLSSVHSITIPLHVLGLLVAHHQEVTMYICKQMVRVVHFGWQSVSQLARWKWTTMYSTYHLFVYIHCYLLMMGN